MKKPGVKKTAETDTRESRERILRSAEEMFAEKGFDGARVDEIARRAGVNKALIYYYFKSKDDILNILLQKLIEDVRSLYDFSEMEELVKSREKMRSLLSRYVGYLDEHRNLLRIFFMESLKSSEENLFTGIFLESAVRFEKETIAKTGKSDRDEQKMIVLDFFTAVMPLLSFVLFKKPWCKTFGVAEKVLEENFLDGFMNTHVGYTKWRGPD